MAKINSSVNENLINIIGSETEITGQIVTKGDIRIDGKLKGNLKSEGRVVIGETGTINGEIECGNIEVYGSIFGKLTVRELTMLKSSAKIEADIITKKLGVEPGAIFTGHCEMSNSQSKPDAERPKQEKAEA
jgi:cytoskeletal protein CcmA (bactofilin family)